MRIGLVIPSGPGYSETFFRSKIKGLQKRGHQLILFGNRAKNNYDLGKYVELNPWRRNRLMGLFIQLFVLSTLFVSKPRRIGKFLREEKSIGRNRKEALKNLFNNAPILNTQLDFLHFGFATMALNRENLGSAMGAKMAVSLRGFDICIYPLKHPGCYLNLWTKVDKVHSISDDNTKRAFENGMKPEQLVSKICPAIDPGKFGMSEWKMNKEHPKILTVARLHWKKGLEDSLIALSILRNLGIQFQYNIVGAGDEFERLKYISYKLGLTDSVHFLGKKSHEEVRDLMSSHQIYLQYSLSEGFCNAVLEAQASGLLCIVSDAEGLPENVMNGETGWVIPRSNPPLLAGKLQELISLEQSDVQRVRQAASKRVAEQFNLTKQEGEFHKFYVQ